VIDLPQTELQQNQTWKLTLAYDGTDFHGWQIQPGESTIQGQLQSALGRIVGESPLPQGSGRTDAGVHALAQVASFALQARNPVVDVNDGQLGMLASMLKCQLRKIWTKV